MISHNSDFKQTTIYDTTVNYRRVTKSLNYNRSEKV